MTVKFADGGPAFPLIVEVNAGSTPTWSDRPVPPGQKEIGTFYGMSLRDYFAAKAMHALYGEDHSHDLIPSMAYQMADAMLKAREASND